MTTRIIPKWNIGWLLALLVIAPTRSGSAAQPGKPTDEELKKIASAVPSKAAISTLQPRQFVRAFYPTWYKELVTELPKVADGFVSPLRGPGLGTQLIPDVLERPDVRRRSSRTEYQGGT